MCGYVSSVGFISPEAAPIDAYPSFWALLACAGKSEGTIRKFRIARYQAANAVFAEHPSRLIQYANWIQTVGAVPRSTEKIRRGKLLNRK